MYKIQCFLHYGEYSISHIVRRGLAASCNNAFNTFLHYWLR